MAEGVFIEFKCQPRFWAIDQRHLEALFELYVGKPHLLTLSRAVSGLSTVVPGQRILLPETLRDLPLSPFPQRATVQRVVSRLHDKKLESETVAECGFIRDERMTVAILRILANPAYGWYLWDKRLDEALRQASMY